MEYAALAFGGLTIVIVGLIMLNLIGRGVSRLMRQRLGGFYEYAAIFYVIALCVLALLGMFYFVLPLLVWLALIGGTAVAIVVILIGLD